MPFVHNTSLVTGEAHAALPQEKRIAGCAALCFLDADGNVLARPASDLAALRHAHAAGLRVIALRRRGGGATTAERKELFLLELRLGIIGEGEIAQRVVGLDLDAGELDEVARRQTDFAVLSLTGRVRELGPERVAASIYAMARAGRLPGAETHDTFWLQTLACSAERGDALMAERAEALLRTRADRPTPVSAAQEQRWQAWLDQARRQAKAKARSDEQQSADRGHDGVREAHSQGRLELDPVRPDRDTGDVVRDRHR